jgi:hypothetical protein
MRGRILQVVPSGFNVLDLPTLLVRIRFSLAEGRTAHTGNSTIRFTAQARLHSAYFVPALDRARAELSALVAGGKIVLITRARQRLADLESKAALLSRPLPVEGERTVTVSSTSALIALFSGTVSWILIALGALFGGIAALIMLVYYWSLTQGRIET